MAEVASTVDKSKVLNFNVGVLGHIDSGKTSLGKSIKSPHYLLPRMATVHMWRFLQTLLSLCHGFAAKALSTVASTAAFDKNPQSRERGITLDLGK